MVYEQILFVFHCRLSNHLIRVTFRALPLIKADNIQAGVRHKSPSSLIITSDALTLPLSYERIRRPPNENRRASPTIDRVEIICDPTLF
jgi:hypothetical protein